MAAEAVPAAADSAAAADPVALAAVADPVAWAAAADANHQIIVQNSTLSRVLFFYFLLTEQAGSAILNI